MQHKLLRSKPILFKFLGGNLLLRTHALQEIHLSHPGMTDTKLTVNITENDDKIVIGGQNTFGFFPQQERVSIEAIIPDESDCIINVKAADIKIYGKYSNLDVKLLAGDVNWWLQSKTLNNGNISMWFGDAKVFIDENDNDKIVYEKNSFFNIKANINSNSLINCSCLIGDIGVRPPKNEKEQPKF